MISNFAGIVAEELVEVPDWVELEKGDQAFGFISEETASDLCKVVLPYMGPIVISNLVQAAKEAEELQECVCGKHTSKKEKKKKCQMPELQSYTMRKTKATKINPVDDQPNDSSTPEGSVDWKKDK